MSTGQNPDPTKPFRADVTPVDDSPGKIIGEQIRQECNKLSDEQRQQLLKQGLETIYATPEPRDLRDAIATAVAGHIFNALVVTGSEMSGWPGRVAGQAYELADAMMAERERRQG